MRAAHSAICVQIPARAPQGSEDKRDRRRRKGNSERRREAEQKQLSKKHVLAPRRSFPLIFPFPPPCCPYDAAMGRIGATGTPGSEEYEGQRWKRGKIVSLAAAAAVSWSRPDTPLFPLPRSLRFRSPPSRPRLPAHLTSAAVISPDILRGV